MSISDSLMSVIGGFVLLFCGKKLKIKWFFVESFGSGSEVTGAMQVYKYRVPTARSSSLLGL